MDYLISALSGVASSSALILLFKGWISERLKQSIQHEYALSLEGYKTELNSRVERIRHDQQVFQLRTSLFFDHQRSAFAALITKIEEASREWAGLYEEDEGLYHPVPSARRNELEALLSEHQLFLDEDCLMALSLVTSAYSRSLPWDDRSGDEPHQGDCSQLLSDIGYLRPRIASIFREKIGVTANPMHLAEVAIFSAMELVNTYSFEDAGIPPTGALATKSVRDAADKVAIGLENVDELLQLLRRFDKHLSKDNGWIHESHLRVRQTLNCLERCMGRVPKAKVVKA
jgi:hypothetical protein